MTWPKVRNRATAARYTKYRRQLQFGLRLPHRAITAMRSRVSETRHFPWRRNERNRENNRQQNSNQSRIRLLAVMSAWAERNSCSTALTTSSDCRNRSTERASPPAVPGKVLGREHFTEYFANVATQRRSLYSSDSLHNVHCTKLSPCFLAPIYERPKSLSRVAPHFFRSRMK